MESRRKLLLACLVTATATQFHLMFDLLDDAASANEIDESMIASFRLNQSLLVTQLALVGSAAEPFLRPKIRYSIGPEKYSLGVASRKSCNRSR